MASGSGGAEELEKPPASFKSHVWEHFGFPVKYKAGRRVVNRNVYILLQYVDIVQIESHMRMAVHPTFEATSRRCVRDGSQDTTTI